jgi:HEAT repeat protein
MSDDLSLEEPAQIPDRTATTWLVRRALEALNSTQAEQESAYGHAVELLQEREDAVDTVFELMRTAAVADFGIRWSALHVTGDIGDERAAERLARAALESLPEARADDGCETARDSELLIRTMAVEALRRVAMRHPPAGDQLLRVIAERPARPVLIEAVKAAGTLKLTARLVDLLPDDDRWLLDIKTVPVDELVADPERRADVEPSSTPPKIDVRATPPTVGC